MLESIVSYIQDHPEECIILGLFIVSEILGSMDRFKTSSVFQLLVGVLRSMLSKTVFAPLVHGEHTTVKTETTTLGPEGEVKTVSTESSTIKTSQPTDEEILNKDLYNKDQKPIDKV